MGKTEKKLDPRINDAINELLLEGHFERLAAMVKAKPQGMATIEAGLKRLQSPGIRRGLQIVAKRA